MMFSEKRDCESLKYLIPLYVKGTLSDNQREEIEKAIDECPDFTEEIEKWKKINDAYKNIEIKMPQPSKFIYSIISEKIKEPEQKSLIERLLPSRRLSFAFIVAQLLIIIALGFYLLNLKTEYRTLTSPSISEETLVKINVVFREDISETDLRNLLLQCNARITDGPFRSGLYVIGISSEERLDETLGILRRSGYVVMAERAY